jgi:hypothetical protein
VGRRFESLFVMTPEQISGATGGPR